MNSVGLGKHGSEGQGESCHQNPGPTSTDIREHTLKINSIMLFFLIKGSEGKIIIGKVEGGYFFSSLKFSRWAYKYLYH